MEELVRSFTQCQYYYWDSIIIEKDFVEVPGDNIGGNDGISV